MKKGPITKMIAPLLLGSFLLGSGCAANRMMALNRAFGDEVEEGKRLIRTGHYSQAIDDLSMLLEMDPKNKEARISRAVAYQQLEEFPLAIRDYEEVLKENPGSSRAHYNLGMIYAFKLNEPRRALEHFNLFLSADPKHSKAFNAAKIMCSIDWTDSENRRLQEIVGHAMETADPDRRRKELSEAAKEDPHSPLPYYLIGKSHEYQGEEREAIRSYEKALEIRPTCAPCHEALGKLLVRRKKNSSEGRIHLLKADLLNPTNVRPDFEP